MKMGAFKKVGRALLATIAALEQLSDNERERTIAAVRVYFAAPPIRSRPMLIRSHCARGHPDATFGTTNTAGYRRCRRCIADNQARHAARKGKR